LLDIRNAREANRGHARVNARNLRLTYTNASCD
jgi:hypothetical protein